MNFKKIFSIIPVLSLLFLCSAKDLRNSYDEYKIGLVVANTSILNASYETPLYDNLRYAGHKVTLIDTSYLDLTTYDGTHAYTTLDLVVIPNFVSCPSVDTSKGIGDVPVIVMEDSLWDSFGFLTETEEDPIFYISDGSGLDNYRLIRTGWGGSAGDLYFKTIDLMGFPESPTSVSLGYDKYGNKDSTQIFVAVRDTIKKFKWDDYASAETWGTDADTDLAFNFAGIAQIQIINVDNDILISQGSGLSTAYSKLILSRFGASDSATYWKFKDLPPTGLTGSFYINDSEQVITNATDYSSPIRNWIKKINIQTGVIGDSIISPYSLDNCKLWYYDGYLYAGGDYVSYKINYSTFAKIDSVLFSNPNSGLTSWYDYRTGYNYVLTDQIWYRFKFNGTTNGGSRGQCFSGGLGTDQIYSPTGIEGYYPPTYGTMVTDSIYISNNTDSLSNVFATGVRQVYSSAGNINFIASTYNNSTTAGNIIARGKDNDTDYTAIAIDTLNNKLRVAWGLYDVSKLSITENGGWTLLNRTIGRLKGSEADSSLFIGMAYSTSVGTQAGYIKNFYESNMHKVELVENDSLMKDSWDGTNGWDYFNLIVTGPYYVATQENADTLRKYAISGSLKWLNMNIGYMDDFYGSNIINTYNFDRSDTGVVQSSSHVILDYLGYDANDTLVFFTDNIDNRFNSYRPSRTTDSLVTLISTMSDTSGLVAAHINKTWAYVNGDSVALWDSLYWDVFREVNKWLVTSSALLQAVDVTVTTQGTDSLLITWSDVASGEDGYGIYLLNGGYYTGSEKLLTTVGANVEADTLGLFWPPSSLWYLDARVISGGDTLASISGGDSAFVLPAQPARPIVYALSDTAINILLNGYLFYDLFTDTTLATNPTWYRPEGKWYVEKSYNRLRSNNALDSTTITGTGISTRQAVTFNGTDTYVYIDETAGSLDSTLDIGLQDYMYSFWMKRTAVSSAQERIVNKRNGLTLHDINLDAGNKINAEICDGTFPAHYGLVVSKSEIDDTNWHHITVIMDRDSSGYIFIDSAYDTSNSISISNYDVNSSRKFVLGRYDETTTHYLNGSLSDMRTYRFGIDGLTITGTHATNDLLIKLDTDTIYCQATDEGLVKQLYQYPNNNIDFSNTLVNGDMEIDAGWASRYTPLTNERSSTKKYSGSYSRHVIGNGADDGIKKNAFADGGGRYEATVHVFIDSGSVNFQLMKGASPYTLYNSKVISTTGSWQTETLAFFKLDDGIDSVEVSFSQSNAGNSGFWVDDVVIQRVEETAWWKFTEVGYPDTLYDETSNNLDLVTSGDVLVSGAGYNTISSDVTHNKDVEWSIQFHLNDSLRLNKQWVKYYFNSSDSLGVGNGYVAYLDSSLFRVYKQTANVYADTLIDTTWTGNYKWNTLKVTQNYEQYPTYKGTTYSAYLNSNLMGTFSDTTYQQLDWVVLQASHRRQFFDNVWIKNTSPGANAEDFTYFAIIDSTSGQYLQANHTFGASPYWATWDDWGAEDGFYAKMSPFTSKRIRVIAKPKED